MLMLAMNWKPWMDANESGDHDEMDGEEEMEESAFRKFFRF